MFLFLVSNLLLSITWNILNHSTFLSHFTVSKHRNTSSFVSFSFKYTINISSESENTFLRFILILLDLSWAHNDSSQQSNISSNLPKTRTIWRAFDPLEIFRANPTNEFLFHESDRRYNFIFPWNQHKIHAKLGFMDLILIK